jgi:hypothetical protein
MTKKQIVKQCTKQILIDAKLRNRKIGQKNRADWERSPSRRWSSALHCSATLAYVLNFIIS